MMMLLQVGRSSLLALVVLVLTTPAAARLDGEYDPSPAGTRWLESGTGLTIKVLVEAGNLGSSEVEVAEITFPAGSQGGPHVHEAIEIFYILEGELDHVVNGETHRLEPGMVGVVKPGDQVIHRVVGGAVRAVVIWAPGGEAERLAGFFSTRAVEQ